MDAYISPLDLVRERSPHRPVALARPVAAGAAARWFGNTFKGCVLYAVKANPSPWMIRALSEAGIDAFDVASLVEIELVAEHAPGARLAFMHPVKSREAIAAAYHDHGVRAFALDSQAELAKIIEATGGAGELDLIVRMAVTAPGAAYAFGGKFGVTPAEAPDLLLAARRATDGLMGVSFHVGSQCMRPAAFPAAMGQVSRALVRAGVLADIVDVGGGFPSIYPGMTPPEMSQYVAAIDAGFEAMMVHETTELWCEPGRALCAEASSLLTRVELRRGDALHLNDGAFGSLFDAAHLKWPFPVKRWRGEANYPPPFTGEGDPEGVEGASGCDRSRASPPSQLRRPSPSERGEIDAPLRPFHFYGPTCDPTDHIPGPFWLPEDTREGDYVEIGMLGAYGVALGTRFNGFGEVETCRVGDPPLASMYGLAPAALPEPLKEGALR